ncbi:MAG: hypothetical protein GY797_26995 [Deltaproteobacteria bacterium]|nr:hypothetical protein [Deltaproteobacteria bacterium]
MRRLNSIKDEKLSDGAVLQLTKEKEEENEPKIEIIGIEDDEVNEETNSSSIDTDHNDVSKVVINKSEPVKCPNCDLLNPPDAVRCDCSFNFKEGKVEVMNQISTINSSEKDQIEKAVNNGEGNVVPVEKYAEENGLTGDEVIQMIQGGEIAGFVKEEKWYVALRLTKV